MNKLSQCQVKTQLSNHIIVATTSHLEKVLIPCTRCTGIYRIYVCRSIVSPALTCRIRWKNLCSAHLLPHPTVTSNHWRIGVFVRITDPSFLLKLVSRFRGKSSRFEQNKETEHWLSGFILLYFIFLVILLSLEFWCKEFLHLIFFQDYLM